MPRRVAKNAKDPGISGVLGAPDTPRKRLPPLPEPILRLEGRARLLAAALINGTLGKRGSATYKRDLAAYDDVQQKLREFYLNHAVEQRTSERPAGRNKPGREAHRSKGR